jgi:hypothetical protein
MNSAVMITVSGDPWDRFFLDMHRLVQTRHAAYCQAHKFDYWSIFGYTHQQDYKSGMWEKIWWIQRALEAGYPFICWMDADAGIHDITVDLRDALKGIEGDMGLCQHENKAAKIPPHLNVGVMYMRNTPRVKEFVDEWMTKYPGDPRWQEQGAFNDMRILDKYAGLVCRIDDRWNSTVNVTPVPEPVVMGWHGVFPVDLRYKMMRNEFIQDALKYRL